MSNAAIKKKRPVYLNLVQRLVLANAYNDPEGIDEVIGILHELRDAWSDAVARVSLRAADPPAIAA